MSDFYVDVSSLSTSRRAYDAVEKALGKKAARLLRENELDLDEGLEAAVEDFFNDEVRNEAENVWSGEMYSPDNDNPDTAYPIDINEYEGLFFVWAMDHGAHGCFDSKDEAFDYICSTFEYVRDAGDNDWS